VPEWQRERIKKKLKRKIRIHRSFKILRIASIAAVILLAAIIAIEKTSPVLAKNIPFVNSILQMFNDKHGYQGNYTDYSQLVNKSITDHGITVTINEALADDTKIMIGYTIKSNTKIEDQNQNMHIPVEINRGFNGDKLITGTTEGDFLDDFTYVGSSEFDDSSIPLSDQVEVDINIREILGKEGRWDFAFTVSKDELIKKSTVFNTDVNIDFQDSVITVNKVVLSPIDTTIFYSGVYKDNYNAMVRKHGYWLVFDDQGRELAPKSGGGGGDAHTFTESMHFEKANGIPHYLTVIPCIFITKDSKVNLDPNGQNTEVDSEAKIEGESSRVLDGKYPFALPQGKMGKLIIKGITTENGETVIRFTTEGKASYHQALYFYISDADGNEVAAINKNIRRDPAHPNEFTNVYPLLDFSKRYYACTSRFENVELLEDRKFTIELKQ